MRGTSSAGTTTPRRAGLVGTGITVETIPGTRNFAITFSAPIFAADTEHIAERPNRRLDGEPDLEPSVGSQEDDRAWNGCECDGEDNEADLGSCETVNQSDWAQGENCRYLINRELDPPERYNFIGNDRYRQVAQTDSHALSRIPRRFSVSN